VLLSAEGVGTNAIMRETGKSKTCVWRWQERFAAEGVDGLLHDKTRPSRIPKLATSLAERVVALTMEAPPSEETHWTGAAMAKAASVSVSSVQRIWRAHGLQPHRVRQFKLSKDPEFVDKLRDVVGLYVDPPAHAVVHSVDEKSQIQALDRTQPGLPASKTIHAILDIYAAHKHPAVRQWLARHPRWTLPLHADFGLLAQRRRGLLRHPDQAPSQTRRLPVRRRPPSGDQSVPRRPQRRV
jgi:transposase